MQKLGWYNYTVEYKKGITNIAADAFSRHPDLQSKQPKFIHFSEQRGFPYVQLHVSNQNDVVVTNFEHSVLLPRACMTNDTESTINTKIHVPVTQIGCKAADRQFLEWYVSRAASHLSCADCVKSVEFAPLHDRKIMDMRCPECNVSVLDQ